MLWRLRLIGVGVGRFDGINGNCGQREQFAGARDVLGALAAGVRARGERWSDRVGRSKPAELR